MRSAPSACFLRRVAMASDPTITDTPVGSGYIELSRVDSQLFMGSTGYQRNLCDAGSGATQGHVFYLASNDAKTKHSASTKKN